jgi:hypothetical protein
VKILQRVILLGLIVVLGCGAWQLARAEVSAQGSTHKAVYTLLMDHLISITDGADPIPTVRWKPFRMETHRVNMLNPSGEIRHDGRPDVFIRPENGWPVVVWAYNNGTDHDIAFAEWRGEGWSPVRFLTSSVADEVDPRVFIDRQHNVHVVFWVDGNDPHVRMISRPGASTIPEWDFSVRVTPPGEDARRPTVAVAGSVLWIAYESRLDHDAVTASEMVVLQRGPGDSFTRTVRLPAQRGDTLDPILHVHQGHLWLDWKLSDDKFVWIELRPGGWSEPHVVPWIDRTWVGVESLRLLIRRRVMSEPPTIDALLSDTPRY